MVNVIETPRLLLLPLSHELMTQSLTEEAFSYQGYHFAHDWAGEAAAIFPLYLLSTGEGEEVAGSFAIVECISGSAVGMLGTKHVPKAGQVEIGYGLTKAARGQGYATEALAALLEHVRGWNNVKTVQAETLTSNYASIRVLEKCGFVKTPARDTQEGRIWWAVPLHST